MAFSHRAKSAEIFEDAVERYCLKNSFAVARNGTEHTHPNFVEHLRLRSDPGSRLVRFAPDGVLLSDDGVIHWEAKNAKAIERTAYDTYMQYHAMGCRVMLFVRRPGELLVYAQWVEEIRFRPSIDVVSVYPTDRQHPIDDDGWICPRKGKGTQGLGSGTPYKEFDMLSLQLVDGFDEAAEAAA